MARSRSSPETLNALLRKAETKIERYEAFRATGDNPAADRLIPEMFELRKQIISAYREQDSGSELDPKISDRMQFLLRALAPGLRRPAKQKRASSSQAQDRKDPGRVSTELIATALRRRRRRPGD